MRLNVFTVIGACATKEWFKSSERYVAFVQNAVCLRIVSQNFILISREAVFWPLWHFLKVGLAMRDWLYVFMLQFLLLISWRWWSILTVVFKFSVFRFLFWQRYQRIFRNKNLLDYKRSDGIQFAFKIIY